MTLTELAEKLHEIFDFDFLTVSNYAYDTIIDMNGNIGERYEPHFELWQADSKEVISFDDGTGEWGNYGDGDATLLQLGDISCFAYVDLSEYADGDGNIDYSKCIVEVK